MIFYIHILQTNAIERLIARRHGLVGKNEWEEAQIDAYVALIYDTFESKQVMQ